MTKLISNQVVEDNLPLAQLADFLQLQSGETGEVRQDDHLKLAFTAAVDYFQSHTSKTFLQTELLFSASSKSIRLPYGRDDFIEVLSVVDATDDSTPISFEVEVLTDEAHLSILSHVSSSWHISCHVGNSTWDAIHAEVRQSIMMLAAYFYEARFSDAAEKVIPPVIKYVIEKHRDIKILRGVS